MVCKPKNMVMPFLSVFLVGFAIYAISLDFYFLVRSDDTSYIFRNPYLQNISSKNIVAIFSNLHFGDYLPITLLSYSWDFTWWRFDPFGYRLTQITLHALNACLLFAILNLLEVSKRVSWFSVLVFVAHPVQVESVVWIAERKSLLSSLFILMSLWFYLRFAMSSYFNRKLYYFCLLSFVMALLSKSISVMLPCVFVLLDILVLKRTLRVMEKVPFFLLSLLAGLGTIYSQGAMGGIKEYVGGSFVISMLYTARIYWDYVVSLIFPFQLSPLYHYESFSATDPQSLLAYLIFFAACFFIARNFRLRPCLVFAMSWFVLWLIPVSNLIPISVLRQDRYLYLPSIALIVVVAIGLENWGQGQRKNFLVNLVMMSWVLFLGSLSFTHTFVYANEHAFWQRVANQNPQNAHAHLEAGYQCKLIEDLSCAEKHYRQALAIRPQYVHALSNLGALMIQREQYQEARVLIDEAIRIKPTHAVAYNNRILLAEKIGEGRENISMWKKKYDLFKKKKPKTDYLLGGFRFR